MPRRKGALPKLWRKRKGSKGPYTGNYICKVNGTEVNLRTVILDGPDGAIARSKEALNGRRSWPTDADRVVDDMERAPPPAATPPALVPPALPPAADAAPPPPPSVQPDSVIPPPPVLRALPPMSSDADAEASATSAAAEETAAGAAGAAGGGDQATPPEVNLDELAELAVDAQVWCAAEYVRYKVHRGFATPQIADEGKKQLAAQWKKIAEYSGAAVLLPPWVTGLLIPGAILLTSTFAMARSFADAARQQAAGANEQPAREPVREAA